VCALVAMASQEIKEKEKATAAASAAMNLLTLLL
jgi:hypothetical protein